jgi:signal-induced proliferation-associated 1 like protein 3
VPAGVVPVALVPVVPVVPVPAGVVPVALVPVVPVVPAPAGVVPVLVPVPVALVPVPLPVAVVPVGALLPPAPVGPLAPPLVLVAPGAPFASGAPLLPPAAPDPFAVGAPPEPPAAPEPFTGVLLVAFVVFVAADAALVLELDALVPVWALGGLDAFTPPALAVFAVTGGLPPAADALLPDPDALPVGAEPPLLFTVGAPVELLLVGPLALEPVFELSLAFVVVVFAFTGGLAAAGGLEEVGFEALEPVWDTAGAGLDVLGALVVLVGAVVLGGDAD